MLTPLGQNYIDGEPHRGAGPADTLIYDDGPETSPENGISGPCDAVKLPVQKAFA